jgi:hypothetical protein
VFLVTTMWKVYWHGCSLVGERQMRECGKAQITHFERTSKAVVHLECIQKSAYSARSRDNMGDRFGFPYVLVCSGSRGWALPMQQFGGMYATS